jgi:hypothetical protein
LRKPWACIGMVKYSHYMLWKRSYGDGYGGRFTCLIRATERHGFSSKITESQCDTKLPLNINDTDLSAEDAVAPTAGNECTEMSFCLIRYKYTAALCLLRNPDPLPGRILPNHSTRTIEERKRLVEECQNQLENEHFQELLS